MLDGLADSWSGGANGLTTSGFIFSDSLRLEDSIRKFRFHSHCPLAPVTWMRETVAIQVLWESVSGDCLADTFSLFRNCIHAF